mmetsp:Transcript_26632/g.81911  ORF Transcript_26632/g.81911 Transcript_26632/m.81911 type:complete len:171 (-) Transcript_26632:273-785(-)
MAPCRRRCGLAALAWVAVGFRAVPAPMRRSLRRRSAEPDEPELSPEEAAKFAELAPKTAEEEAALFASLKDSFAQIEGTTYGGARPEDYEDDEDDMNSELRKAAASLSKEDRRDLDRAAGCVAGRSREVRRGPRARRAGARARQHPFSQRRACLRPREGERPGYVRSVAL